MIMAGRGRRLGDFGGEPKRVGTLQAPSNDSPADMPTLLSKIEELDMKNQDSNLLKSISNIFYRLCTSKETMNDIVSELHSKAMDDVNLREKIVVVLEKFSSYQIDDVSVRTVYFALMQRAFEEKDSLSQSDPNKFLKAVTLLGTTYNISKLGDGKPINVLGEALLDYLNMLTKGEEEELKTLTKQILMNGANLTETDNLQIKYDLLKQNLRNSLITRNLSLHSKCWILLAIDFMSNGFSLLTGAVKDFYASNLGDEFTKLESLVQDKSLQLNNSTTSPESVKSQDGRYVKPKMNANKKDFSKKFSDMNIKTDEGGSFRGKKEKVVSPHDKNPAKDNWRSGRSSSGHDDRFEKDENFYGVQMPRRPKPVNQKKSVNSEKTQEFNESQK